MAKKGICRVLYYKKNDSYALELRNDGENNWETVMIAECQPNKDGDTTLIHYTFLTKLLMTVSAGYELIN